MSEEINLPLPIGLLPQLMVKECLPGRLQPASWLHLVPRSETNLCGIVSPEQRLLPPHPANTIHPTWTLPTPVSRSLPGTEGDSGMKRQSRSVREAGSLEDKTAGK